MSIIFIDKPKGITSFGVCNKLKKVLNTNHIGHSGTLDPNATGVMVIGTDKDTKVMQFLLKDTKEYIGTCTLGIKTDSLDIDGKVLEKVEQPKSLSKEELINTFNKFIGKQKQKPPMYSAIKVDGKRLYELARQDKQVEVKERDIEVFSLDLLDIKDNTFTFKCLVSSGTYIRVLLEDILKDLNTIGVLSDLRRTKSGSVSIDDCNSFDDVLSGKFKSYTVYEVLKDSYFVYETNNIKDIKDGKPLKNLSLKDEYILVSNNNEALAIYKKENEEYTCVRGLF